MEVPDIVLYWPVPDIELEKQVPQWYWPAFGLITARISDSFPWACPQTFLFSLCPFQHLASYCFSPFCPNVSASPWLACPRASFWPVSSQFLPDPALFTSLHASHGPSPSALALPSPPLLPGSALRTGSGPVTKEVEGDTGLWLPLVNVSTTSSLRKRKIHKRDGKMHFFFILFCIKKVGVGESCFSPQFLIDFTLKLSN